MVVFCVCFYRHSTCERFVFFVLCSMYVLLVVGIFLFLVL